MRRNTPCIRRILFPFLLSFMLPMGGFSEEISPLDVMTDQEAKDMGLDNTSEEKKQAFSRWLEKWTRSVIREAPTYHPSQSISAWIRSWPPHASPNANMNDPQVEQAAKKANLRIFRNRNGKKIELKDGSVWDIVSFDQFTARLWQRDDAISIEKTARDLMRPYILHNTTRNEEAAAKLAKPASPNYTHPEDSPEHFQGAKSVTAIDIVKGYVQLSDGSTWKVAPTDRKMVEVHWKVRDRIRVGKSGDSLYRFSLENLDNGDTILAIEMK